jgi:hypothetical protein
LKQVKKPPQLKTSQGTWARSNVGKGHAFTEHLAKVFQPHPSENEPEEEAHNFLRPQYPLEPSINRLNEAEVQDVSTA